MLQGLQRGVLLGYCNGYYDGYCTGTAGDAMRGPVRLTTVRGTMRVISQESGRNDPSRPCGRKSIYGLGLSGSRQFLGFSLTVEKVSLNPFGGL